MGVGNGTGYSREDKMEDGRRFSEELIPYGLSVVKLNKEKKLIMLRTDYGLAARINDEDDKLISSIFYQRIINR